MGLDHFMSFYDIIVVQDNCIVSLEVRGGGLNEISI